MRAYFYLLKNSYFEDNLSTVSLVSRLLQPFVTVSGYFLFYQFILANTGINLYLYYGFILLLSVTDVPRFSADVQKDIQTEGYLMIERLPIHPFLFYLFRNIGRKALTFAATMLASLVIFLLQQMNLSEILFIYAVSIIANILLHLLCFLISTIVFYFEQLNMWFFGMLFEFLSGKIIPFMAMPPTLAAILMYVTPLGITIGGSALHIAQYDYYAVLLSMIIALIWLISLYKLTKLTWDRGSFYFQEHG